MRLRLRILVVFFSCLLVLALAISAQLKQDAPPSTPILGFTPLHAAAEHQLESQFHPIPSPDRALESHRTFTAEPQPAASDRTNQLPDLVPHSSRLHASHHLT